MEVGGQLRRVERLAQVKRPQAQVLEHRVEFGLAPFHAVGQAPLQRRAHEQGPAASAFGVVQVDQAPARQHGLRIAILQNDRHDLVMAERLQDPRPRIDRCVVAAARAGIARISRASAKTGCTRRLGVAHRRLSIRALAQTTPMRSPPR